MFKGGTWTKQSLCGLYKLLITLLTFWEDLLITLWWIHDDAWHDHVQLGYFLCFTALRIFIRIRSHL